MRDPLRNLHRAIDLHVVAYNMRKKDQLEFFMEAYRVLRVRASGKDLSYLEDFQNNLKGGKR